MCKPTAGNHRRCAESVKYMFGCYSYALLWNYAVRLVQSVTSLPTGVLLAMASGVDDGSLGCLGLVTTGLLRMVFRSFGVFELPIGVEVAWNGCRVQVAWM